MTTTREARQFNVGDGDLKPVAIALLGATGVGKSTFANLVSGSHLAVSDSLKSCTNAVQVSDSFTISGRSITLIDTPGFDNTTISATDVLKMIAGYLAVTYEAGFKLSGLIYTHRISDCRIHWDSRKDLRMLRKLSGDAFLKNVAIVTTMWDQESSVERAIAREEELMTDELFFKPLLDKGAQMLRHDRGLESARDIVSRFVTKTPMALQIQRELVEAKKELEDTAAGAAVQGPLMALIEEHKREINALREDGRTAIRERDEEIWQELEDERKKLEGMIATMEEDRARLSREFEEEKQKAADEKLQSLRELRREQQEVDTVIERIQKDHNGLWMELHRQTEERAGDLQRLIENLIKTS